MEQEVKITWHDVKTLPSKSQWTLVTFGEKGICEAYFDRKTKRFICRDEYIVPNVIAWADMPGRYSG